MKILNSFFLLTTLLLTACGGSKSGGGSSSGSENSFSTGTFFDDPVEGLAYSSPSVSGITGSGGSFECVPGETITFTIGNLTLGSASCANLITPIEIRSKSETDFSTGAITDVEILNIAYILQNLDDGSTPGQLTIPASFLAEDWSSVSITESNTTTMTTNFNNIPGATETINRATAGTNFQSALNTKYQDILSGKVLELDFTTNSDCDQIDDLDVTATLTLNTSGGAGSWTVGAGAGDSMIINGTTMGLPITLSSSGQQRLAGSANILATYLGQVYENDNDGYCSPSDDSTNLSSLTIDWEFTFQGENSATGVMKESYNCGSGIITTTCQSFSISLN